MKTLQNNFTTPEQSKRLLELGVPADSADCVHTYLGIKILPEGIKYSNYDWMVADGDDRIPCWSVGQLMAIYFISKGLDYWSPQFKKYQIENSAGYFVAIIEENIKDLDLSKLEE